MNDTHVLDAAAGDIPALRSDLSQAPTALAKLEVAKAIQAARDTAAQPAALVGNDVAVPLEPLLVEWVPRFRSSFPPEFRTLPKRSQHLLFTTGVDLSMMQLTASASVEGQKAAGADRAASDIAKIKACEAAGYKRQRVKLAGSNTLGFVFVKDGLAVTPEGAAKLAGLEAPAPAVSRVRVTKTEARDAYDSLSYSVTSYKQHHDSELLSADVPGILGPKMAVIRDLVARGWPDSVSDPAYLLQSAQDILDRYGRLQSAGLTQDMGRGEAWTYLNGKGLSEDRINEILANPTSATKSKGIAGMSDLDIPAYTMAYLNEEADKPLAVAPQPDPYDVAAQEQSSLGARLREISTALVQAGYAQDVSTDLRFVKGEVTVFYSAGSPSIQRTLSLPAQAFSKFTVKTAGSVGSDILDDLAVPADQTAKAVIAAAEALQPAAAPAVSVPVDNDLTRLNALKRLVPKGAITSDDPQALEKLRAKLAALMAEQEFMKKANKFFKKKDIAGLLAMGLSQTQIDGLLRPDFAGRIGFADYLLTNNNGVISATRKRIAALEQEAIQAGGAQQPSPVVSAQTDARPVFKYAMVNRPLSIGTSPTGWVRVQERPAPGSAHYDAARHGIIVYDRELSAAETKQYELAPLVDDMAPLAKEVAASLAENAQGYIEALEGGEAWAKNNILREPEKLTTGFPPSLANPDGFVRLVLAEFKAAGAPAPQGKRKTMDRKLAIRYIAQSDYLPKPDVNQARAEYPDIAADVDYLMGVAEGEIPADAAGVEKVAARYADERDMAYPIAEARAAVQKRFASPVDPVLPDALPDLFRGNGSRTWLVTNPRGFREEIKSDTMIGAIQWASIKSDYTLPASQWTAVEIQGEAALVNEDTDYLKSVINGTIEMLDPGIFEKLEPMFTKYADDAEMMDMLNKAAEAYTAAAVAAAKGA